MNTTVKNTILDEVKIYVGTYEKYNNGSIFGEWLTLGDYENAEEFYNACRELHADETEPEFMFQDWDITEEFRDFISECGINENLFLLNDLDPETAKIVLAYAEYMGELTAERITEAQEKFIGEFNTLTELAEYFIDDLGLLDIPDDLRYYFDFEKYGESLSYDLTECGNYYFYN